MLQEYSDDFDFHFFVQDIVEFQDPKVPVLITIQVFCSLFAWQFYAPTICSFSLFQRKHHTLWNTEFYHYIFAAYLQSQQTSQFQALFLQNSFKSSIKRR